MAKTLTRSMTYDSLVAEIVAGTLNKGEKITITDFATKHYVLDGYDVYLDAELNPEIITGVTEPLTVTALSNNTISHEATSELYPQDKIHYDWNPANWIYDIAFANYDEAVLTGFKGVIYFRRDTLNNNSLPFDFRNVRNRRWAISSIPEGFTSKYIATASYEDGVIDANDHEDYLTFNCSESQYNSEVFNNCFDPIRDDGTRWYRAPTILQNNVFHLKLDHGWYQVINNKFSSVCFGNTFSGIQDGNTYGALCVANIFGDRQFGNVYGMGFENNKVYSPCDYNFWHGYIQQNTIPFVENKVFSSNVIMSKVTNTILNNPKLYDDLNCEIFTRLDGTVKIRYFDNSDISQVEPPTVIP